MWGALSQDFREFVSTVTTDASETLTALDGVLDNDGGDGSGAYQGGRTIIDLDTGMVLEMQPPDDDEEDADEDGETGDDSSESLPTPPPPPLTDMEEIKEYLYTVDQVFLEDFPQSPDTKEKRGQNEDDDFDLDARTEEIATLLQTNAGLEAAFSRLTDQVEYKQFWKRYYDRFGSRSTNPSNNVIDEEQERRLRETYHNFYYKLYEQEQRLQRQKNNQHGNTRTLGPSALLSVTNFLGGAVKRIIDHDNDANDDDDDDDDDNDASDKALGNEGFFNAAHQTGASAINFFKKGGRPPFVLNTAVSENEDDGGEGDEDEVELGWDDDDDDDNDVDDENGDDDNVGQIEFKDAEKEGLQEQLNQALSERDLLHKTVEMQTAELKRLKEGVASTDETKQVQALKMELFEKESELAALRARLEDDDDRGGRPRTMDEDLRRSGNGEETAQLGNLQQQQQQLAIVTQKLAAAEATIQSMRAEHQAELDQLKESNDQLKQQVISASDKAMENTVAYEKANEELRKALQERQTALQAQALQIAELKSSAQAADKRNSAEKNKAQELLGSLMEQVQSSENKIATMTQDHEEAMQRLRESIQSSAAESSTSLFEARIAELEMLLQEKDRQLASYQAKLETALVELAIAKAHPTDASAAHPSSPGSSSTGVKVEVATDTPAVTDMPKLPAATKLQAADDDDNGNEEDSDWGDW